jgi:hypothetical protein
MLLLFRAYSFTSVETSVKEVEEVEEVYAF